MKLPWIAHSLHLGRRKPAKCGALPQPGVRAAEAQERVVVRCTRQVKHEAQVVEDPCRSGHAAVRRGVVACVAEQALDHGVQRLEVEPQIGPAHEGRLCAAGGSRRSHGVVHHAREVLYPMAAMLVDHTEHADETVVAEYLRPHVGQAHSLTDWLQGRVGERDQKTVLVDLRPWRSWLPLEAPQQVLLQQRDAVLVIASTRDRRVVQLQEDVHRLGDLLLNNVLEVGVLLTPGKLLADH